MKLWATWRESWAGSRVADEAAAFLRGELLEELLATGSCGRLPPWTWLNAVAHGDVEHLRRIAGSRRTRAARIVEWGNARSELASELVELTAGDPAVVARLQREVLVPLEQEVDAVADLTPRRMLDIAVEQLRLAAS